MNGRSSTEQLTLSSNVFEMQHCKIVLCFQQQKTICTGIGQLGIIANLSAYAIRLQIPKYANPYSLYTNSIQVLYTHIRI
jgi:hypothetical protein